MASRYRKDFIIFDTEWQAQKFCDTQNEHNRKYNRYVYKRYPAYYTPWNNADNTEHKFIAWYVTQ